MAADAALPELRPLNGHAQPHTIMSTDPQRARRAAQHHRPGTRLASLLLFARTFVKHPLTLGSVVPSSRHLIRHLLSQIDFGRARVIVEYGPGVGPITRELLRHMRPDAHLVAVEMNAELAGYLREHVRDPRLHVVGGSAEETGAALARLGLPRADHVVSGIPFSTMSAELRRQVVEATKKVLQPTGTFLVYQFSRAVLPDLRATFTEVREEFEPRNLPPARLFYCAA